jgi:uncharacterized protein (DUF58 family)
METTELLKKVRKIEIKTRGLSSHIFSGEYHSAFKGRGMAFSEVREYIPGDDIRSIDWNVTARFNHPYVKVFEEERELTVILLVDVSASGDFGTKMQFKKELITELCAVLSFSAIQNNDKIGIIFFTDKIEKFIPPKKGKTHILRIIRELIEFKPENKKTNISEALRYVTNVIKKRSIAFLISDFMDTGYEDALKLANKKHDIVGLRIYDQRESELPEVGIIRLKNAETNELIEIDTSDSSVRHGFKQMAIQNEKQLGEIFAKSGVDFAKIRTDESYITPLMQLFKKREKRA